LHRFDRDRIGRCLAIAASVVHSEPTIILDLYECHWTGFGAAVKRCQAADKEFPRVTVHELRHTAASLMIASGANVRTVQSQLGHKTATMTVDQYGHLFPDDLNDVAEDGRSCVRVCPECARKGNRPGRKYSLTCMFPAYSVVELPGIETDALPGNMPPELPVRSVSIQFRPAGYLRFRFRVLTASMLTIYCSGSQDWSGP
jgi:hypothetical protein